MRPRKMQQRDLQSCLCLGSRQQGFEEDQGLPWGWRSWGGLYPFYCHCIWTLSDIVTGLQIYWPHSLEYPRSRVQVEVLSVVWYLLGSWSRVVWFARFLRVYSYWYCRWYLLYCFLAMVDPLVQIYPRFCWLLLIITTPISENPAVILFYFFTSVQADSSVRIRTTDIGRYEVDPKESGMRGTVGTSAWLAPARIE